METITLINGAKMPVVGFGTFRIPADKAEDMVYMALKTGYRHVDCASSYMNEHSVGKAFKKAFEEEKFLKREDVFIVSKLWNTHHGHVGEACKQTLKDLNLEYLDLYLIHFPFAFAYNGSPCMRGSPILVKDEKTMRPKFEKVSISDTWKEMEKLVEKGLVKAIGVSNFRIPMILDLVNSAKIQPAVHQYESHPFFQRGGMSREMKKYRIGTTAYSPLGSDVAVKDILGKEGVRKMAEKYKKTKAQVVLRWGIDRGHVIIVKCSSEARLKENFDVHDFKLDEEDMKVFKGIDKGQSVKIEMFTKLWGFSPLI